MARIFFTILYKIIYFYKLLLSLYPVINECEILGRVNFTYSEKDAQLRYYHILCDGYGPETGTCQSPALEPGWVQSQSPAKSEINLHNTYSHNPHIEELIFFNKPFHE